MTLSQSISILIDTSTARCVVVCLLSPFPAFPPSVFLLSCLRCSSPLISELVNSSRRTNQPSSSEIVCSPVPGYDASSFVCLFLFLMCCHPISLHITLKVCALAWRQVAPWGLRSNVRVPPDVFSHIAVGYGGGRSKIYINGTLRGSQREGAQVGASSSPTQPGPNGFPSN